MRLRILWHFQQISHNISLTCRFFGVSRNQFYIWQQRFEKEGTEGLRDRSRKPKRIHCRLPPGLLPSAFASARSGGRLRMSLYLLGHYQVSVQQVAVLKIIHRHHMNRVSPKRFRPSPKLQTYGPLELSGQLAAASAREWCPVLCLRVSATSSSLRRIMPGWSRMLTLRRLRIAEGSPEPILGHKSPHSRLWNGPETDWRWAASHRKQNARGGGRTHTAG